MQSVYEADPKKVIVCLVGCTRVDMQCPLEAKPTSAKSCTAS